MAVSSFNDALPLRPVTESACWVNMPSLTDIDQTTVPGIDTALAVMDIGIRAIGTGNHHTWKCETLFTPGRTKPLHLLWKHIACGIEYLNGAKAKVGNENMHWRVRCLAAVCSALVQRLVFEKAILS